MAAPGLVVIDRDEARVFRTLIPGTEPVKISADVPPTDSAVPFSMRNPPSPDYLAAVAQSIGETGVLQVYGRGPNSGGEVEALIAWLDVYQPEIAGRVVFTQIVPDRFASDNRLLTQARNYLASQQTRTLSTG
jgi:hypothetical protein